MFLTQGLFLLRNNSSSHRTCRCCGFDMEGLWPLHTTPKIVDYQAISVAHFALTTIFFDTKGVLQLSSATPQIFF